LRRFLGRRGRGRGRRRRRGGGGGLFLRGWGLNDVVQILVLECNRWDDECGRSSLKAETGRSNLELCLCVVIKYVKESIIALLDYATWIPLAIALVVALDSRPFLDGELPLQTFEVVVLAAIVSFALGDFEVVAPLLPANEAFVLTRCAVFAQP